MTTQSLSAAFPHSASPGADIPLRHTIVLWLTGGTLAFLLCMYDLPGTLVQGVFLPTDQDSFYHARRILDAIPNPLQMYQFDPRIHAPEGSWITWPWAYDMMMAFIAKALMSLTGAQDPRSILAFVAPAWVFVNIALLIGVTARLRLPLTLQAIAVFCFAASTLTRTLHRVGMMDHHYVEQTFVLAMIFLGLGWFQQVSNQRRAALLGIALGVAPAFHNGLFILQLPVLITLACLWWLRRPLPVRAVGTFAIALAVTTALFLLPSEPFRQGMFSFYLHSWFHLYIAFCSGVVSLFLAKTQRSFKAAGALLGIGVALMLPIVSQILEGGDFLLARIMEYDKIGETQSIAEWVAKRGVNYISRLYSYLLWLLPAGLAYLCWRLRSDSSDARVFFVVAALFGSILLLQQIRLEYFGSIALYLPLCMFAADWGRKSVKAGHLAAAALAVVVALAYLPCLAMLRDRGPIGGDATYMLTRSIYPKLHAVCAQRPGIVLASFHEGHYITYHSDCSVIADGFILTRQHQQKVVEVRQLLQSNLDEVLAKAPYIRYIYVRRADDILAVGSSRCYPDCPENAGLRKQLLVDGPPFPPQLKLVAEKMVQVGENAEVEPYARLFEVVRTPEK